jgi:hypothetical protein
MVCVFQTEDISLARRRNPREAYCDVDKRKKGDVSLNALAACERARSGIDCSILMVAAAIVDDD